MNLEFSLTDKDSNTQYAPLAALSALYRRNQTLAALEKVDLKMKTRDFSPVCKLKQVLVSILAGCKTLTAFNSQLDGEVRSGRSLGLAAVCRSINPLTNLGCANSNEHYPVTQRNDLDLAFDQPNPAT